MKKKTFWAFACFSGLLSCQPTETVPTPVAEVKIPIHFVLHLNEEILPFPSTKGIPVFDVPEPTTMKSDTASSKEEKEVDALCQVVEYIVYNDKQPKVTLQHRRFMHGDDDFGIVYDSLPAGNYTVAFLAHSSVSLGLTDSVIQLDTVSDTFWKTIDLEVQRGAEINESISLARVVSRIEFVANEKVPEDLKSFRITSEPRYDRLNVITGKGLPSDTPYTQSYLFSPEERGETGLSFGFFTFIPSQKDPLLQITLTAEDTEGNKMHSQTISSVKPLINRQVRYSGFLYTPPASGDTFPLTIDDEWDTPDEHPLKD